MCSQVICVAYSGDMRKMSSIDLKSHNIVGDAETLYVLIFNNK